MRNTRWLRYGLTSIVALCAGMGATLLACGDDEVGSTPNVPDTGTPDTNPGDTDSGGDSGGDPDAAKVNPAKITIVNATTDMGPDAEFGLGTGKQAAIRICFKQGKTAQNTTTAPYPPLPDRKNPALPAIAPAGIFYGTGGTFPSFGLPLEGLAIVPIIMNAWSLAEKGFVRQDAGPSVGCDELVGPTADAAAGLVANEDYWELPAIEPGTLKNDKSYVLVLTGCVANAAITNQDKCGDGFTAGAAGVGNLKVNVYETNRTPVSATQLGAQFIHASPSAKAVFTAVGAPPNVSPGFVSNTEDGGGFRGVTPDGGAALYSLTPAIGVTGVVDSDYFALAQTNPLDPPKALLPYPLPAIQALSGLGAAAAPTVYKDGQNFVFIAVGDPDQTATAPYLLENGLPGDGGAESRFNPRFFHFLAFPTDPVIQAYVP